MWYEIERICGHVEELQIYGTNIHGERDKRASWLASQPCDACKRAARAKATDERSKAMGFTNEMAGSQKQVVWAKALRAKRAEEIRECVEKSGMWDAFINFANTKDAKFWIDTRDVLFPVFWQNNLAEIKKFEQN